MSTIDAKTLARATGLTLLRVGEFATYLSAAFSRYEIDSQQERAAFIAQVHHESGGFSRLEENLTYTSASRLCAVWPGRFPTLESAEPFVRNPEALANKVYGGRMGNVEPGDGWKYRGRGLIQLTGRDNYAAYARDVSRPEILRSPDILLAKAVAVDSACWFWSTRRDRRGGTCKQYAEAGDIRSLTKLINGGTHGLAEREAATKRALAVLSEN